MKSKRAHCLACLLVLVAMSSLPGCIMAARKAIGTIVGANSTIKVMEDTHTILPNAKVGMVALTTEGVGSSDDADFDMFRAQVVKMLEGRGLYDPGNGTITLVVELLTDTNLPARKKVEVNVGVSCATGEIGEAVITTNLNGLGTREDVGREMAEAIGLFLDDLRKDVSS